MLEKIKASLKSKGFWAGVASTIAAVLGGAMAAPEAIVSVLTMLIGG